jgi:hypothetical protein
VTERREIHLYCLCWNEARILPHFLRHYDGLVDRFFVFDNGSTDGSLQLLAGDERVKVTHFDVAGDSFVDEERRLSDTMWQSSRRQAAWTIVIDMDEFLYHADLRGYLTACAEQGVTAVEATAYDMIADAFPSGDEPLPQMITCGAREPFYDKLCIFDPDAIVDTHYDPGRHTATPEGRVIWPPRKEVKLLHYKRLGVEYVANRYAGLKLGLRPRDIRNKWGVQYLMGADEIARDFREFRRNAVPVPGLAGHKEPELWLTVGERTLRPADISHNKYVFCPPSHCEAFHLVSSAGGSPCRIPVSRIVLRGGTGVTTIATDDPGLAEGWSTLEQLGQALVRWTNGHALVPVPCDAGGLSTVEITLTWPLNHGEGSSPIAAIAAAG